MRSLLAGLRSLLLPFAAAANQRRILLDGVNATINFYGAGGVFFGTLTVIGGLPGFYVFGPDGSQAALAVNNATGRAEVQQFGAGGLSEFSIRRARIETDTVQAAVGPVGAIVGKLELFNTAGASIGFLPVYSTIT